jgi:hypothetical protein
MQNPKVSETMLELIKYVEKEYRTREYEEKLTGTYSTP